MASLDLALLGSEQPNGYTEPLLHFYRKKQLLSINILLTAGIWRTSKSLTRMMAYLLSSYDDHISEKSGKVLKFK